MGLLEKALEAFKAKYGLVSWNERRVEGSISHIPPEDISEIVRFLLARAQVQQRKLTPSLTFVNTVFLSTRFIIPIFLSYRFCLPLFLDRSSVIYDFNAYSKGQDQVSVHYDTEPMDSPDPFARLSIRQLMKLNREEFGDELFRQSLIHRLQYPEYYRKLNYNV